MPRGILGGGAWDAYMGARQQVNDEGQQQLRGLLGILAAQRQQQEMQQAAEMAPLTMQNMRGQIADREAQARYRDAQIQDMQRRNAAMSALSGILSGGGYQGTAEQQGEPLPSPTSVAPSEDAALAKFGVRRNPDGSVSQIEGQQIPTGRTTVDVPSPALIQGLALQADPQHAMPEILRQMRPDKPLTPRQEIIPVTGGYIKDGQFVRTAQDPVRSPEPLAAVIGPDGKPVLVPRSEAAGRTPAPTGREAGMSPQERASYTAGLREVQKDQSSLANVDQLENALKRWDELNQNTPTGRIVGLRWAVAQPSFQEMTQLQNYLAVNNFKPGQGQISNFERQLIKGAGPNVNNDPETNSRIVRVQLGAVRTARERADFKEAFLQAKNTTLGADKAWNEYVDKNPRYTSDASGNLIENQNRMQWPQYFSGVLGASRATAAPSAGGPAVGSIENGYRFKGGNPGSPDSWERVQ